MSADCKSLEILAYRPCKAQLFTASALSDKLPPWTIGAENVSPYQSWRR